MAKKKAERVNLTPTRIAAFSCPADKGQAFLFDEDTPSLAVRATPSGSKSYVFEAKLDRRTIRMTIGDVRERPLNSVWVKGEEITRGAREIAQSLATMVADKKDPREERAAAKAKAATAKAAAMAAAEEEAAAAERAKRYTLAKLYEAYCTHLDKAGKTKTARVARNLFKNHVSAKLKGKVAAEVRDEEIADALRAITEKGKKRTAGALRTYLHAAFKTAVHAKLDTTIPLAFKEYGVTSNPVSPIKAIPTSAGNRVLTNEELATYYKELGDRQSDTALSLALLAGGQRMEQLLRATVQDWTPQTKTLRLFDPKGRRVEVRTHLLPLGPKAARIVESLIGAASKRETRRLLDLDPLTPGKRVKEICAAKSLDPFNLRDIRRTVETRMASLGISKDTRAQVLSHGISGVQDKHYDMHDYADEKRAALVAWERFIDEIVTGKKVSNITRLTRKKTAA